MINCLCKSCQLCQQQSHHGQRIFYNDSTYNDSPCDNCKGEYYRYQKEQKEYFESRGLPSIFYGLFGVYF